MPESMLIDVAKLGPHRNNPRFEFPMASDLDAYRAIAQHQKAKLIKLARSVATTGWDEGAQLYVEKDESEPDKYIVREGNRRLCALRALESTEMFVGALSPSAIREVQTIRGNARANAIPLVVRCLVYGPEEDALLRDRLRNRHVGEQGGAGVVNWGAVESTRFDSEGRRADQPAVDVIEFLRRNGRLSETPVNYLSTLRRMLTTPELRERMGVATIDGDLFATHDLKSVADALSYVVDRLASGALKVGDVYYAKQRIEYANDETVGGGFPREMPPHAETRLADPIKLKEAVVPVQEPKQEGKEEGGPPSPGGPGGPIDEPGSKDDPKGEGSKNDPNPKTDPKEKPRATTVVPGSFRPIPPTPRIGSILKELRELEAEKYGNACGVLLRVLLELSIDEYRASVLLIPDQHTETNLELKMRDTASRLLAKGELTVQQHRAIVAVASENSVKGVHTLHALVHNQYFPITAPPIFAMWDTMEDFFAKLYRGCAAEKKKK